MARKKDLKVQVGEVYAGQVKDGRWAAAQVLRIAEGYALLGTTAYLGTEVPTIDDPALRTIVRNRRFAYKGQPSLLWTSDPPPKEVVRVGSFSPTAEALSLDPGQSYALFESTLQDAYYEWRWEHDRDAFIREMQAQSKPSPPRDPGRRRPAKGSSLGEADFWALIRTIDADAGDQESTLEPLVRALSARSAADIREFQEILAEKLYRLDGRRYAEKAGVSDDGFLYARCYVVAKGKTYYEAVLAASDTFPEDQELESLLYAASKAHEAATGDDLDLSTHFSFETGSNPEGWKD